jgi:hypothetical protein
MLGDITEEAVAVRVTDLDGELVVRVGGFALEDEFSVSREGLDGFSRFWRAVVRADEVAYVHNITLR